MHCPVSFRFCSPSRTSAQTGRNPIHVNTLNLDPINYNPKDNVSGYSGAPRNMTTVAQVMQRSGYATAFTGKWDVVRQPRIERGTITSRSLARMLN